MQVLSAWGLIEGTADFFVGPEDQSQQKCNSVPLHGVFLFFFFSPDQKHEDRKMNPTEVNA